MSIEKRLKNLDPSYTTGKAGIAKAQKGEVPSSQSKHRSSAEIKCYNAQTNSYDLLVQGDDTRLIPNVPIKTLRPGTISPLLSGTTVILDESLSTPYIDGAIPGLQETAYAAPDANTPQLGESSSVPLEDVTNEADDSDNYRTPNLPTDAMPGEWVETSPEGNYIGVLRGKLNEISSSKKAKIITDGNHDLVKVICEDYEHISSLGTVTIKNEEGRSSLVARFAADQLNEGGGTEEQWTFRMDVGNSGGLFKLEVTEGTGKTKAKFHISPDGRITILATNGIHLINAGKSVNQDIVKGSKSTKIDGSSKLAVEGDINVSTKSSRKTSITASDSKIVGNDDSAFINRDSIRNIGRNQEVTVTGGSVALAKPSNVAVNYKVLNGSYVLNIGDPLSGANPAAMAGYSLFVHCGDIIIGEDPLAAPAVKATVALNTLKPESIALGGTIETSLFHAMLYEYFEVFTRALLVALDSHVHKCTAPGTDSAVPTIPITPVVQSLITPIKSIKVKIGA